MAPTPVHFGASGWQGILGDDFTFFSLRRAARAVARFAREETWGRSPRLLVGYDTRFLSERLSRETARVFGSEGVRPLLASDSVPVPAASHAVRAQRLDGGVYLGAGAEPFETQGLSVTARDGAPASSATLERIEGLARRIPEGPATAPLPRFEPKRIDPSRAYRASLLRRIDRRAIARGGLMVVCDPLHGSARGYLEALLSPAAGTLSIRSDRDVRFGGGAPDCSPENLQALRAAVRRSGAHLGLAVDGDGRRFGIVDRGGHAVPADLVLALLADYLLETRGHRNGIGRGAATTRLLDDVAALHGVPLCEVSPDSGGLRELLLAGTIFMAGNGDGRLALADHLPGEDGILAGCLVAEMVARRGTSLRRQIRRLFDRVGPRHSGRWELPIDPEDLPELLRRLGAPPASLAGIRVRDVRNRDGALLLREDGSWLLLRPSETGRQVRCHAEARTPKELARLLDAGRALVPSP